MSRYVVTGGAGFIGSHLVDALVSIGAEVVVLDSLETGREENLARSRAEIELHIGDIRDEALCRRLCRGVRVVFHQAALGSVPRSMREPAHTFDVNVGGTSRLLAAAREEGVERVVYASSSAVYGDSDRTPKREGEEGHPLSPYGLSKRIGEELAEVFARCYGLTSVGLRYFNVYGPRQRPDGPYAAVVPRFVEASLRGEPLVIYGDGRQSRDFTFVADVVTANLKAAVGSFAGAATLNIGGGASVTVEGLARVIGHLTGNESPPRYEAPRPGDVLHSRADTTRAADLIGFRSHTSLERGLAQTLEGYAGSGARKDASEPAA